MPTSYRRMASATWSGRVQSTCANGPASGPSTDCAEIAAEGGSTDSPAAFAAHGFFPAEFLLASMLLVGGLAGVQRSTNPYLTLVLVATVLGLIRAVLAGSILVPLLYFMAIGAGFALASALFKRRPSA